ncbi:hypothetical protein OE059_03275 [Exiguobacterium profundum]|uniref:Ig-like domain-containing protein n=1 Tax=Exiguobacterium profundum TaxID=307643 RepID=A0ABY8B2P5_9BACL|nr:hypothetical protein [Exiguobacterium profundum]WED55893.1 hypothetical protein OE059_03275 [Exiguobacterium profundum]
MKRLLTVIFLMLLIVGHNGVAPVDAATKEISRIVIPSTYTKQYSGHPRILKLDVVYTDGSVKRITKGVKWSSSNKPVARVGKETVVAGVPGKATLTATYGGKKTSRHMTVSIPSKQSDVNWLKLHQASIFYDGNFYGNSVNINDDIRKIKGPQGALGRQYSEPFLNGVWNGKYLLSNITADKINVSYQVTRIATTPKLYGRTITYNEVVEAFGKSKDVVTEEITYLVAFYRNDEEMYYFKHKSTLGYTLNNHKLVIMLDEKNVVRSMYITSK